MLSLGTMSMECLDNFVIYVAGKTTSWISLILFPALLNSHLFNVELRHNVAGVPKTTLYSTLTGKTTSWISLILFPALLYCDLLNVELRHNVDGVPRQLCHLRCRENHVLDLSNTSPCLAILSPLGCVSLGTMWMACLKPLCTLPWRGKPPLGSL